MTVSTTQNRITYNGNGITTVFAFPYKFIETADIAVYVDEVLQVEDVDYTVGTPSDSGANVTFGTAPVTGTSNVVILRDPNLLQETDLPTNGRLPADSVERMVDKVTLIVQRLRDLIDRTVRRNDADPANTTLVLPVAVANKALIFDADGNLDVGVDDYLDQAANAAASAATASAAADAAAASYDDFDDRYLGPKASEPTLDNDGNALAVGALYYNTVTNRLRIYNGASWQDTATASPASFTSNMYSGTGAQTAFTLSTTPASSASVIVSVSGVLQRPTTDYSVSGSTITFVAAPPLGTNNVLALVASTVAAGTPDNDSVSTAKIQDGAVTSPKLGGLAVLTANIANAAVALSKLVTNIFDGATIVTPATNDYVVIADSSDSGNTKKVLVSSVFGLINSMVRLNTSNGYGSTNTTVRRFTNVVTSQGSDITYADSATLGASFTINTSGVYAISYSDSFGAAADYGLTLNSTQLNVSVLSVNIVNRIIQSTANAASIASSTSWTGYLVSGDIIRAQTSGAGGGSTDRVHFTITRVA